MLSLETKLKQYTNDQTNNIQVGGRNLLRETKDFSINASWQPYFMVRNWNVKGLEIIDEKFNGNVVRKVTGDWQGIKTEAPDIIGEPVTISFWAKTNVWAKFINSANNSKNTNNIKDFTEYSNNAVLISDNQWHRYTIYNPKGMCLGNGVSVGFLEFYKYSGEVLVSSIKIEKGNKATDWSPAPEDLEAQIQNEQQARTQAIATAKTATEAYARTQSELTKAQAIAEANKQAGIALTAEQQARILQLQQNLQQAKTFAEQKVNELNVGGRNLLRNSGQKITNNYYNIAIYNLTEELKEGDLVTLSIKAQLGNAGSWLETYNGGTFLTSLSIINGVFTSSFLWKANSSPSNLIIYVLSGNGTNNTIEWVKLEKGNKPTDWSPAPEDIENKVADIQTDLQNAINNAKALIAAESQNIKNSNARIQNLENKTQIFSDTQIDGNVIATGTLIVGNTQGTKAGVSGTGLTNDSIRFWAGEPDKTKPIETPKEAEDRRRQSAFLVLQDGTLHATNAHISGHVEASSGHIGNFKIESTSETSLKANGLHIASQGLIRALGNGKDSRTTQVRINDPEIFKTFDKSAVDVYSSGHNDTTHSAMKLESRGGRKSTALILKAIWGQEESVALNIEDGDIKVKGEKGYTGSFNIPFVKLTVQVTNGIITSVTPYQ